MGVSIIIACRCTGVARENEREERLLFESEGEIQTHPQLPEQSDEDEEGLTTEQQVQEALNNLPNACDISVPCDLTEDGLVATFVPVG